MNLRELSMWTRRQAVPRHFGPSRSNLGPMCPILLCELGAQRGVAARGMKLQDFSVWHTALPGLAPWDEPTGVLRVGRAGGRSVSSSTKVNLSLVPRDVGRDPGGTPPAARSLISGLGAVG